ncbi:hypothetical protein A4X03_0g6375 [Tilletia caries]|uniref:Uncharacterized protein n=1 Tax=Tilletia caries TaxID=13290 RepID=A0A8T8SYE8_9BASI|nr:hypothetical protein A4X03_0g6375 [Tilletia caries]
MSSTRSIHEAACSATCAPATTGPGAPITYDPSSTSPRANSGDDSMDDSMSELLQQLSAALEPTASQACIARLNPATREVLSSAYYALKGFVDQGINMDWSGVQAALDHMTDEAAQDTVVNVLRQWFDTAAVCNLEDAFRKFLPNQGGVLEAPQPTTESTEAQKVNETNGDQDMDDEEGTDDGHGQGAVVLGESYTQNQSHSSPFGNELYQTQPALANTDANLYCGPLSARTSKDLTAEDPLVQTPPEIEEMISSFPPTQTLAQVRSMSSPPSSYSPAASAEAYQFPPRSPQPSAMSEVRRLSIIEEGRGQYMYYSSPDVPQIQTIMPAAPAPAADAPSARIAFDPIPETAASVRAGGADEASSELAHDHPVAHVRQAELEGGVVTHRKRRY